MVLMYDAECPYCGADVEICHDDGYGYEEDMPHEDYCSKCGKHFVYHTQISFYYSTEKADCLNDGEHDYEETNTYPRFAAKMRCTMCGDEIPLSKEEYEKRKAEWDKEREQYRLEQEDADNANSKH